MHRLDRGEDPEVASLDRVTLASPDGLEAAFVPGGGMVATSLSWRGQELLARRRGLRGYLETGATFGIPLLAPWGNRLAVVEQEWDGVRWEVRPGAPGVRLDEHGRAMHGLLAGEPGWRERSSGASDERAWLETSLDFDPRLDRFAAFPFEHRIDVLVELVGRALRISTTVTATGGRRVPLAIGWHPWFAFPDVPRADWRIRGPLTTRAVLDEERIPTGEVRTDPLPTGPLGHVFLDDLFLDVAAGTEVAVAAGEVEVVVRYVRGFPVAVVFAPLVADVVCVEPMTAPTDPFAGRWPVRAVEPGEPVTAVFEIEVVAGPDATGH